MNRCLWLICESEDRWQRGLNRFNYDRFLCRAVTCGEARALAVHVRPLIIIWELPENDNEATQMIRSLTAISRTTLPPLQFAAFPAAVSYSSVKLKRLSMMLRQLGADLILRHPEELPTAIRLASRYAG